MTPVPRRRPQVLALQVATLDELSGGRAVLGAGLGGNRKEFEEFGESFDTERRWQLLEDGLAAIRELWAGPLGPREIPIWIGGNSTRARRLAARYDGWLPDSTSPEEMTMTPDDIRDETQKEIGVMGYSEAGRARHSMPRTPPPARRGGWRACTTGDGRTTRCSRACARDPRLGPEHTKEGDMAVNVDVQALRGISGSVLTPTDDGYDEARRVHNGLIDRRPAVIVRCQGASDVAAAVRFARDSGLDISVRGGGHNVAGRCVADDAVMIDLSEMRGIAVDADARTLRAEGGCTWAELNGAAAEHGLAVTGGAISTTGIAGLTLGGGLGWLMAKHGLAADNLLACELVTADGEIVDVTADSHPDLFWALRGGGGNFGVATTLTYRVHPLETVVGA